MVNRCGEDICRQEETGTSLARAFQPVSRDMQTMRTRLAATLRDTPNALVREIVEYLLETPGKQLRPALVLLSACAVASDSNGSGATGYAAVDVAAAVEIIHMASLIHDDLVDDAALRHHRPSVHVRWNKRVAVMAGDYLYAKAFQLVAECADSRLFANLGASLCDMCHGEMQQVVGRDDFQLSESYCLTLAEKKTAALFSACCHAGAVTGRGALGTCSALEGFGRHFGIAFQILDDCRDLVSDQEGLGKTPGQDLLAGDVTLPLLYAIQDDAGPRPGSPLSLRGLEPDRVGAIFCSSSAPSRIAELIASHVDLAKRALGSLVDSDFKGSLHYLADALAGSAVRLLGG